ncbi:hypothetical protein M3B34_27010, partial [Klebsiella quasipneumoniae]|nr:hypothetical protein [Klebsiella quasipneumoniae]
YIASLSAGDTATSCVLGPQRAGVGEEDPEHTFFGSQERKREIIAAWTQKSWDCCDGWIIAILATILII